MKKASLLFTVLISVFIYSAGFSQSNKLLLISEKGIENRSADKSELWFFENSSVVQRYAEITLSQEILTYAYNHKDSNTLSLNLFDDINYEAVIDRTNTNVNGSHIVRARIDDSEFSYMLLSTTGNRSLGIINMPAKGIQYKIISCPETNIHYLLEMRISDLDYIESSEHPIPPPISEKEIAEQRKIEEVVRAKNLGPDDLATIDVLIVYTASAQSYANGTGGIENVVNLAMEVAQLSHDNSQTLIHFRLAHSALVYYTESGSSSTDLSNLTNGTGALADAHVLRNEYGADLVAMFTNVTDTGGIGWLLNAKAGRPTWAFCITRIQQATGTTHAHETGHNMGCHHHKDQNFQPGPTIWSDWPQNTWSAGWRWTGTDNGKYCDLMSYASGSYYSDGITHNTVAYFSNPLVSYAGVPTGDGANGDNANTLREIKHVISAYRGAVYNSVEGTVTDLDLEPISGVLIKVGGTPYMTTTDNNGQFVFSSLADGTYTLTASKEGYGTDSKVIEVITNETAYVSFQLEELSIITLSGKVFGADDPETGVADVYVSLSGNGYFETQTDEEGNFFIANLYGATPYTLHVFKKGYEFYLENLITENEDYAIEDVILVEALYPADNLAVALNASGTVISWDNPSGKVAFRHDDGVPASKAGFPWGTLSSVLGSAHMHRGYVEAVSWMLTGNINQSTVKVFVMGMDITGPPNPGDILYEAENVPNTHMQWSTHVLNEPVYAGRGFFVGVAAEGNIGLALDNGVGAPYNFTVGTQFYNSDIYEFEFKDMETWLPYNFMVRAYSYDLGQLNSDKEEITYKNSAHPLEENDPFMSVAKADEYPAGLTGYNIYLNNMETPIDTNVEGNEYLFENLSSGTHTVGIQAVYEIGVSEIRTITFPPYTSLNEIEEQIVAIYPNPAREVINVSANANIKEISIYNILGNLVYRLELNESKIQLPLNNYKSGFYFINVTTETGQTTHKIVITK